MSDKLAQGNRAVVSGGTQGLGGAITRAFLAKDFEVTAIYRANDQAAQDFADSLSTSEQERLILVKFDLADGIPPLHLPDSTGKLVVVHNASAPFQPFSIKAIETDSMVRLFMTNVVGAQNLISATIKPLVRTHGTWISVLTAALKHPPKGFSHYVAAKAGLEAWTRSAELELGSKGVRFRYVYPGYMDTALTRDWPEIVKTSQSPTSPEIVATEILSLVES